MCFSNNTVKLVTKSSHLFCTFPDGSLYDAKLFLMASQLALL